MVHFGFNSVTLYAWAIIWGVSGTVVNVAAQVAGPSLIPGNRRMPMQVALDKNVC